MPNEYSVEIHNYLKEKLRQAEEKCALSKTERSYYAGIIEEIHSLRDFLEEHIDLKNFTYY